MRWDPKLVSDWIPDVGTADLCAGRHRGERDAVVLRLERPGAVDHEIGREALERRGEVARGVIQLRVLQLQAVERALPSLRIAARGDDLHAGRHGEPAADAGAEIAVPAYHDDTHGLVRLQAGPHSNASGSPVCCRMRAAAQTSAWKESTVAAMTSRRRARTRP